MLNDSLSAITLLMAEPTFYFFTLKFTKMVKQRTDEPEDKALERLRQFEQQRRPVPDKEDEKKKKEKKTEGNEEETDDEPDSATDKQLE
jgi:hypothetical protein